MPRGNWQVWNGGHTYDTLALRTKDFPDTMHNRETQLWPGMLDSRLVFRGAELIPVQSCFGGLSVYNVSVLAPDPLAPDRAYSAVKRQRRSRSREQDVRRREIMRSRA